MTESRVPVRLKTRIWVRLRTAEYQGLKAIAAQLGVSVERLAVEVLSNYVKRAETRGTK